MTQTQNTSSTDICTICNDSISKYKCPKCFIRYCSINCYKKHKANCSENVESPATSSVKQHTEVDDNVLENIPGWKLSVPQLLSLGTSDYVQGSIRDSRLQKIILEIDEAQDRIEALNTALNNEDFKKFVYKMLEEMGPREELS